MIEVKKTTPEIIFYRESFLDSLLSDISTFGFLLFAFWFNYKFVGGSYFLNGIILVMFLMVLSAKVGEKKKVFVSKEELLNYVNKYIK